MKEGLFGTITIKVGNNIIKNIKTDQIHNSCFGLHKIKQYFGLHHLLELLRYL